jgi:hypothetical protein
MNADSLLGPVLLNHPDSGPPITRQDIHPEIVPDIPHLLKFYSNNKDTTGQSTAQVKGPYFQDKPFTHRDFQSLPRNQVVNDWVLPVLIMCLIILAWIRFSYRKRFGLIIQSSFSRQNLSLLIREGGYGYDLINLSLGLVFIAATALLFYQLMVEVSGMPESGKISLLLFFGIMAGIIAWLMIRLVMIRLLEWIFKTRETTTLYVMSTMSFHFILGILLLPFLVFNAYTEIRFILYVSLAVAGIIFILKIFRGIIIGLSDTKFSIFYLFFYLCTVEILPILVIIKLAKDYL